jgi:hypothetical protein
MTRMSKDSLREGDNDKKKDCSSRMGFEHLS